MNKKTMQTKIANRSINGTIKMNVFNASGIATIKTLHGEYNWQRIT